MSGNGYESAKQKLDMVASTLQSMATLIGEPAEEKVLLAPGEPVSPGLGLVADAANLARRARDIEQGVFKVMVLGEFRNGKSTLLNAMLGHKTLAAKATPTTAIITVLVYGQGKEVAIYEAGSETPRMYSWEEFVREFTLSTEDVETLDQKEYVYRFRDVQYAQMECLHPFCANGVRLIDSPGLGEHISRTRIATDYLKQSQAVIMVLNATRILSQDERWFIENVLGTGRLEHVFFVVNFINRVAESGPEEVEAVKNWVRTALQHHFVDADGNFDEDFYRRRVFFVNALGALRARTASPADAAMLEESGLPAFEEELERFLTSDAKLAAALGATVQVLVGILGEARNRIAQQTAALEQPLAELEQRRSEAEEKLGTLERRKADIERTILLFGQTIKQKVFSSLVDHVRQMAVDWPQVSKTEINLDEVGLVSIFKAFGSQKAKERIASVIEREVQRYVRESLGQWSAKVPGLLHDDLAIMMSQVQAQIEDFQLELDRIERAFSGRSVTGDIVGIDRKKGTKTLQLLLGVLGGGLTDVSQMSGTILGEGDWAGFIGRLVQQIVTFYVLFSIFSGPAAWAVLLALEGVMVLVQREGFKERLLQNLGKRLHEDLEQQLFANREDIYQRVEQQFMLLANKVTESLQAQIDEARSDQERVIAQKRDASFSAEREKARLDTIGVELLRSFNDISVAAWGRSLSPEEVDELAGTRDNPGDRQSYLP